MQLGEFTLTTPWESDWRPRVVGTLVFVQRREPRSGAAQVLLIHKKTGHGAGKVNAPGGKLEPGESVLECARRETLEEVGLDISNPQCRAELRFVERSGEQWLGFAFLVHEFSGTPRESAEAGPFWCDVDKIPFTDMWPDDQFWLPGLLAGAPIQVGNFLFDDGVLLEHNFVNETSIWDTIQSDQRLW